LSVAAATATGYINLRSLDARLALLEETVAARLEALRVANERADVGYTSDLERRQAEGEYESAAQQVPQARLAIARQEHGLALLTGAPPGTIPRGVPLARLTPPPIPEGLPSDLLRRRPDIAQGELTLVAADASLASARAQFLPSVRLTASAGQLLVTPLDPVRIWSLGASVLAPIFDAGRIGAQVETAAARREQAAYAYQRTVLTAFREVEDNLATIVQTREQRVHLQAQRSALADALFHAGRRYRGGYSSYLEQLDAQRGVLAADLALIQARADELGALVALSQAMGGGWTP
jgi:NodT family efflux transporter outer membrane factor (OMF) lipoprotein